ncbi:MAG: lysoplasmalogenase [Flavobacteriales bacterium]|nr:lysoplasmalogenase [Flavobacteriales bacterium]
MFNSLKNFSFLYFGFVVLYMCSVIMEMPMLHYAVKPIFMVLLMTFHYKQVSDKSSFFWKAIQFGLFFSLLGDIALMLPDPNGLLFVVGLLFFLIAHLGYALAFQRNIKDSSEPFDKGKAVGLAIPFVASTGAFFYYIKDELPEELFFPVLAYTLVISTMGILAAWRTAHVNAKTYKWILIGAVLFVLSDCVIAINKFVIDFEGDKIVNMSLYLSGQFMIAFGAIFYNKPNPPK